MSIDTRHDHGVRPEGAVPCGNHLGYAYDCRDCKTPIADDPEENYEAVWGTEPDDDTIYTAAMRTLAWRTERALIEESIQLGRKYRLRREETADIA